MSHNPFYDPTLNRRHRFDKMFKMFAIGSLILSLFFLSVFLFDMISKGLPAYKQTYVLIDVEYTEQSLDDGRMALDREYRPIVSRAWFRDFSVEFAKKPELMNTTARVWALANAEVDQYVKESKHRLKDREIALVDRLKEEGRVEKRFNLIFFLTGDSKIPENSGFYSAIVGSVLTMLVCMAVAFPLGVMTAIYLEEFGKDGKISTLIEVNINNLNAVPSILFGLLGLAIFINLFGMPRSTPLVGGLTLALMTLPVIIVSSRAALRSVPDSIRQAGYGLGLTKIQVVKDHVLPLAFPGMMTGSIIGLAQAIGETAPLIIVGMIAFIPDAPSGIMDAATVMPAQIFTWAGMPERAYIERTAAGILVLLTVLISLNTLAIYLRKKFEVKW